MQTQMPFFENLEDALSDSVKALGGAKAVGKMLFPDKTMEAAHTAVLDCLNPNRKEKFDYSQIIFIFREAKNIGSFAGFQYWAAQCEYEGKPISVDQQEERVMQMIETSSKTLSQAISMLERIQKGRVQ